MLDDLTKDPGFGFAPWRPFFRQWKIGCLVALASFVGACALILWIQPTYKSYIQLLLPIKLIEEDPANRKNTTPLQADAFVVRSYSDIIKDDGIARKVIHDLNLGADPEFNPPPTWISQVVKAVGDLLGGETQGDPLFDASELKNDRVLQDYQGRIKAVSENKALTIVLSFEAHDPHLAQKIVTEHAQAFLVGEVDYRRREAAAKVAWMKNELDRTAAEARDAQVALQLNPTSNSLARDVSANAVSILKMRQLHATATQAVYDSVLKRYQDMVADQSYEGSEIRILSAATMPTHPYFPKKLLCAAAAFALSIMLGSFAAMIASVVRSNVDIAALAASCGLPVLGQINVPGLAWIGGQRSRLRRRHFWQQVHELRSTVSITDKRHPVVVVTSALPKEGKSLIASALARSLASSGVRTLLIDLNGRNARYESSLDPRNRVSVGLQDFLEGSVSAERAASKVDDATPLFLMSDSTRKATDVSTLSTAKLRMRLAALRKAFEAIIIDTPAMESLSDAFQVAALADEIILTTLSEHAVPETVRQDVVKLRARSAQLKGIVIVDGSAPSPADLARIAGYAQPSILQDVWPKAPGSSVPLVRLFKRLLRRDAPLGTQAEASA